MRPFLIALIILLWLILGWLYYKDYQICCLQKVQTPSSVFDNKITGPILFNWANGMPILGDDWPPIRDSLQKIATDSTSLEIIGYYCTNGQPAESDEIGLQRALKTRMLFPEISDDHIIIVSKGRVCDESNMQGLFESVEFNSRIRTENIKEVDDKTMIYFPTNSTQKLNSQEVESYLNDVATRVIKSGESVSLTGHTDSDGDEEKNIALGQRRADIVKNYLISKGVNGSKISTRSKGESEPISDNNTAEGRANNRRTELQIIK